jgi:uncharacterized membrane protein YciS (DUF1049 family)
MILLGAHFSTQIAHTLVTRLKELISYTYSIVKSVYQKSCLSMSIFLNPMVIFDIFCAALILRDSNRHNTSAKHAAYLQSVGCSLVL